jgi:endonuclease/exonuclease/phosphatase family metal-dependent hydrolase
MRVATFNLLHGVSLADGQVNVERLRESARLLDADVVGLQEVDRTQERSAGVDQTSVVAEELGAAHWRFVPALYGTPGTSRSWAPATSAVEDDVDGPTYGVGLVSRLPVRRWWARRFPPAPLRLPLLVPGHPRPRLMAVPDEPRVAIAALVDGPRGPFTVVTAHLSFVPGYNVRQLMALTRWVARMPQPVLVVGDLNLPGPLPGLLSGWASLAHAATYPAYAPRVQFDHVLALGLGANAVRGVEVLELPVSDHRALIVSIELTVPEISADGAP